MYTGMDEPLSECHFFPACPHVVLCLVCCHLPVPYTTVNKSTTSPSSYAQNLVGQSCGMWIPCLFVPPASSDLPAFLVQLTLSLCLVSALKSCGLPFGQFKYSSQPSSDPADLYPGLRQVRVHLSSTSCSLCSMVQQPMHFLPRSGFRLLLCPDLRVATQARYHLSPLGPCSSLLLG